MASQHFWLATIGIVLYTVSMWVAGLTEGLQWRALNAGGQLQNPIFLDIVNRLMPYYWMRLLGGVLYLTGAVMFLFNLVVTIRRAAKEPSSEVPIPASAS
jgi:cbb3-type cytochrome oxidase subunit 1